MTLTPNSLRALAGIPDIEKIHRKKTALIMTGFQMEFFTGILPVPDAYNLVERAVKIMDWADKNKIKTIHMPKTAKSPASPVYAPDSEGASFHPELAPRKNHLMFPKYGTSIFAGTILHGNLQADGIDTLILAGMTTPLSIMISAHDAWSLGYKCLVLADLTASRDLLSWDKTKVVSASKIQEACLAAIEDRFAQVISFDSLTALPVSTD